MWHYGANHAFLWDPDTGLTDLGEFGATTAWGINNAGQVVGELEADHAFIWDSIKGMRELGTLGGDESDAFGINDAGQVVGYSAVTSGDWHAFIWEDTSGMVDLGLGIAWAVNDAGQVVGNSLPLPSAFYWDAEKGRVPLSDILPPYSQWTELLHARGINNRGQIVGTGITNNGDIHAFLMTPALPTTEVPMKFTPQALNCYSKGKWVKAHLVLPEETAIEDVNPSSLATVKPLGIEPDYVNTFVNENGLVEIEAAFWRADFCSALRGNWSSEVTITVRGSFTSGQYFYGIDTIKIIDNSLEYLGFLSSHWLEGGCTAPDWCEGADIDQDSEVNFNDFAFMGYH